MQRRSFCSTSNPIGRSIALCRDDIPSARSIIAGHQKKPRPKPRAGLDRSKAEQPPPSDRRAARHGGGRTTTRVVMIFSRKRNGEPIAALERELSAAQTRKVALDTKLATSQTALTQAIETRRQTLLESDDETSEGAKAVVTHLRDEVDGLLDAGEAIAA